MMQKWSPGLGCAGKWHRQHFHRQPDMKEASHFPSFPFLSFPSLPHLQAVMAEPKIRADQHEHVEAEN
jgi:hypothetical protein